MAKVAGTFLWAPMIKLQTLQGQILGQSLATAGARLSLTRAYGLIKNVGQSPEGYKGLWSGYRPTLTTLLPYTMIYFAIYEQLKQLTRWVILNSKSEENTISIGNGRNEDSWTVPLDTVHENPFPLNLGAYMVCVSGAVALSAAVCHISSALRVQCMEWLTTSTADAARASRSSIAAAGSMTATSKIQGVTSAAAAHIRTISFVTPAPAMPSLPPHYTSTTSSHLSTRLQCQHANLTSIPSRATPKLTPSASTATSASNRKSQHSIQLWKQEQQQPFIRRLRTTASTMAMTMKSSSPSKFLRQITRGLGPRILWTAPGVTLTTAGFEVFRNMALGIV
ncbi:hypothetical protein BGZ83_003385 [Gryganskiella cystojenkinii]|nr:hypothetical protein BGZ83_003385 [Gryganskiella cystojenkinii]